jgi:hypothetical protein
MLDSLTSTPRGTMRPAACRECGACAHPEPGTRIYVDHGRAVEARVLACPGCGNRWIETRFGAWLLSRPGAGFHGT